MGEERACVCKNQGPAPKQESESHDHQMGLYYGVTRYTCFPPELAAVRRTPLHYGIQTRRRGPSRLGAHCPDLVELHGGNVPQEEGGVGGGQAQTFGDRDRFTFEHPGPFRTRSKQTKNIVRP